MLSAGNVDGLNVIFYLGFFYVVHLGFLFFSGGRILYLSQFRNQSTLYLLNAVFYISMFFAWITLLQPHLEIAAVIPVLGVFAVGIGLFVSDTPISTILKMIFGFNVIIVLIFAMAGLWIIIE